MTGGKCPWGKSLGGTCPGGLLSCHRYARVCSVIHVRLTTNAKRPALHSISYEDYIL